MRSCIPVCLAFILLASGCSEHFTNQPLPNRPPETFLTLRPDSTMRPSISQQTLRWWGVDPDGFIVGYYWSFDSLGWNFTTRNDSTFSLKLSGTDTVYRFFVRALDNSGNIDPTAANLLYPVRNTAPTMSFMINTDVPESTYTIASFQWSASDVDGNETIQNILWALDDTSATGTWHAIPGNARVVTLRKSDGLTEGRHVFYARARDVAGALSPIVRMPRDTTAFWYVKEPKGDFLLVDDYQITDAAATFYAQTLDTLMGGRLRIKDVLDLKTGYTALTRGKFVPALVDPDLTETLKLFKYVLWYGDGIPSMSIAALTVPGFLQAGGKICMTFGYPQYPTDFTSMSIWAPVDSMNLLPLANILLGGESIVPVDPSYPTLARDNPGPIYTYPRGMLPKVSAIPLYRMQVSGRWVGQPIMGVKDGNPANVVFVSVILTRFSTPPANAAAFLRRVFEGEFGVQ